MIVAGATTPTTMTSIGVKLLQNFQICTIAFDHQVHENTTQIIMIETLTTDPWSIEIHPSQHRHRPQTQNQSLSQITNKKMAVTLTMAMFKITHDRLSNLQRPIVWPLRPRKWREQTPEPEWTPMTLKFQLYSSIVIISSSNFHHHPILQKTTRFSTIQRTIPTETSPPTNQKAKYFALMARL